MYILHASCINYDMAETKKNIVTSFTYIVGYAVS